MCYVFTGVTLLWGRHSIVFCVLGALRYCSTCSGGVRMFCGTINWAEVALHLFWGIHQPFKHQSNCSNPNARITATSRATVFPLVTAARLYWVSPKKCTHFTMSYLQKRWIWRLQIFYSNVAWVEIVYWKIWCYYLIPLKFCWYLKISKFWAL